MIGRRTNKTGSPRHWAAGFFLLGAFVSAAWAQKPAQPEGASGFAPKSALAGRHFMAVTANPHATDAAVAVLRQAVAWLMAIAAQFVLNVVEPQSSGIGGGGFMLHYDASQGRGGLRWCETAPASAAAERFDVNGAAPLQEVATGRRWAYLVYWPCWRSVSTARTPVVARFAGPGHPFGQQGFQFRHDCISYQGRSTSAPAAACFLRRTASGWSCAASTGAGCQLPSSGGARRCCDVSRFDGGGDGGRRG
jgi:hypothetical protein